MASKYILRSFTYNCLKIGRKFSVTLPLISTRGAVKRTTIKFQDLPQGVLPRLPKLEPEDEPAKEYPVVLQQHRNNMVKYKDCILLTRVGDFYEMYFEHVEQYAPLVGLKMATRKTTLGDVAMAGFQYHQLERYIKMFMDLNKHVAIAEQIPIPDHERIKKNSAAKFDRKVTRVITPGTLVDESFVDSRDANFLLAVDLNAVLRQREGEMTLQHSPDLGIGLAWVDLSSGDFYVQHTTLQILPTLIARIAPREIVLEKSFGRIESKEVAKLLGDDQHSISFHAVSSRYASVSDWSSVAGDMADNVYHELELSAGSIILDYVSNHLIETNVKLQPPIQRNDSEYMAIDKQSLRALEVRTTLRDNLKQGSLLHSIRRTVTPSGARLLGQRIVSPAMSISVINRRLDLAQEMLNNIALLEQVTGLLRATSDTTRLLQKFSMARGDADDLLGIAATVQITASMSNLLRQHADTVRGDEIRDLCFIESLADRLDLEHPSKIAKLILDSIDQEGLYRQQSLQREQVEQAEGQASEVILADEAGEAAPKLARRVSRQGVTSAVSERKDNWVMKRDSSKVLRDAHRAYQTTKDEVEHMQNTLKGQLGVESLTLRFTPAYGYFCHIKGKDISKDFFKNDGIRTISQSKTTRTFALSSWSVLGAKLDNARCRIRDEEEKALIKLRAHVLENLMKLRRNAAVLDELDVACSTAIIARERNFIRPIITESTTHNIVGGRHPTVDVGLISQGKQFTSNDCLIGGAQPIHFITGPNMGGKSTFLRQNALITILAQTGSFVPAEYAEIGLVDKIFSRVGSADNLYHDQSTFMVEMLETAEILKQATPRSFVIMDEIGRGTTAMDGVAVGYACIYHLRYINKCRALFATHFHDLADMTAGFGGIAYHCTDVNEESDGSWAYVHRLREGVNRDSHALKVARLAGMPEAAIEVAGQVLSGAAYKTHDMVATA